MIVDSDEEMKRLGFEIGSKLRGGECIELIGDVGTGKTTLMQGIAAGLVVDEDVQSPSFTLSRVYEARDGLRLDHYDFYRLSEAGIFDYQLAESLDDANAITAVEWAETIQAVLPSERLRVEICYRATDDGRDVSVFVPPGLDYINGGQQS